MIEKDERLVEIEKEIFQLIKGILPPLRSYKKLEEQKFAKLFELLDELKEMMKGEEYINRSIVGLLFYFYNRLCHESQFTKDPKPILKKIAITEFYISNIYSENFVLRYPFKDKSD